MSSKKLFLILCAAIVLLCAGIVGVVYTGDKLLKERATALYDLKSSSVELAEQQRVLVQAKKDIAQYTEIENIARTVVPQEKDQARTVREIISIANRTGIKIANISFPSSTLGATDKKKKATDSTITQLEPVEGITGVYQLEINVQTDGTSYVPFSTMLSFLRELEQNRRTAQVSSLTVAPSSDNRSLVTFNVILGVYIKK